MLLLCECYDTVCECYDSVCQCVNVMTLTTELDDRIVLFPSCLTPSVLEAVHRPNTLCRIAGRKLDIQFLQSFFRICV